MRYGDETILLVSVGLGVEQAHVHKVSYSKVGQWKLQIDLSGELEAERRPDLPMKINKKADECMCLLM